MRAKPVAIGKRQSLRPGDQVIRVVKKLRPSLYEDPFAGAYRRLMGDANERHESWSDYLRRMTSRPGWSVARLARESGIHRGTIFKWIAGKTGATVANVKSIAEALGDDPAKALSAAGNVGVATTDEPLDPDLKLLVRRLSDPQVSATEREFIRRALQSLAELADQEHQSNTHHGRVIRRRRDAS